MARKPLNCCQWFARLVISLLIYITANLEYNGSVRA
nr:MAG TPA: hypothetical protein [Caudoviricetes sp.]